MSKESYLMQQIHKQRTQDSKVLYNKFKGNVSQWLDWMANRADSSLTKKKQTKPFAS